MDRNVEQYHASLRKMLSDSDLRILFWRFIVEDCKVFHEGFPMNASAYCLLAKQEIGKRLLADAKAIDFDGVVAAEKEYNEFVEQCALSNKQETEIFNGN